MSRQCSERPEPTPIIGRHRSTLLPSGVSGSIFSGLIGERSGWWTSAFDRVALFSAVERVTGDASLDAVWYPVQFGAQGVIVEMSGC